MLVGHDGMGWDIGIGVWGLGFMGLRSGMESQGKVGKPLWTEDWFNQGFLGSFFRV